MAKLVALLSTLLVSLPFCGAQLDILAQLAGKKYFGTATDNSELTNNSYVAQLGNTLDFHQLTAVSTQSLLCGFSSHDLNVLHRPTV